MLIECTDAPCAAAVAMTQDLLQRGLRDAAVLLTRSERERAASLRQPEARADFIASHALVRHVAAALAGVEPARLTLVQQCRHCGGAHGPPRLAELPHLRVSLSHAGGIVAAAASWWPVGIDLQRRDDEWRLAELSIKPQQWLRHECLVKLGLAEVDDPPAHDLPRGWIETEWVDASMGARASVLSRRAVRFLGVEA